MFHLLARVVTRRGWIVVVAWVVFAALLEWFAPPWSTVSRDDDVRFFPPGYPSVIGKNLQEQGFPNDRAESNAVIVAERPEGRLTRSDLAFVERLARALRRVQAERPDLGLLKVIDYREPVIGERFRVARPEGGEVVLTAVQLQSTFVAKQSRLAVSRILEVLNDYEAVAPEGLRLGITGSAAVGRDSNVAANESIEATTWATILLVIAILLVVYRSPVLALIPLLSIALSVYVALNLIALLANPPVNFQVINVTQVFIVVILYGAGTDYCLFLIARYREELARGRTRREALAEAIRQVGGALAASAGTVIVGLGMLWFSTFAKIRYSGPAIALSLAIGLLAALTLAPVFLDVLRGAVFWPFRPPHHVTGRDPEAEGLEETPMFGFWAKVAGWVIRRPLAILATSVLAMLPFAWFGLHTKASYDLFADMGPDMPSVRGVEIFRKYYPQGEVGPTTVLVRLPSVDLSGAEGRAIIGRLSQELAALDKVAEVRSLTRPLGRPGVHADPEPGQPTQANAAQQPAQGGGLLGGLGLGGQGTNLLDAAKERVIRAKILEHYLSTAPRDPADRNHITRLDVVFTVSPFSEAGQQTLDRIAAAVEAHTRSGGRLAGAEVGYVGTTVQINDLKHVTTNDLRRMFVLVTVGVYVILVVLLRRPGICLYLIVTVIFGYLATLGLTDLVFKSLHHGPTPWEGLDWKVGFFLFVILVAVGEDYNIFLMSRVIEEENKHGPIEGTRRAVAHTGGIISSCGVIMAGTFGAMLFGKLTTLKQLGFALGLGVLLDTFVVRPILVPAFVVLWHKVLPKAKLDHHAPKEPAAEPASVDEPPPRPPMPAPAGAARFKHMIGSGGIRRGPREE